MNGLYMNAGRSIFARNFMYTPNPAFAAIQLCQRRSAGEARSEKGKEWWQTTGSVTVMP
jgi:hypothetical protein